MNALRYLLIRRLREILCAHLLAQQFLVDQAIQCRFAIFKSELIEGAARDEGLATNGILPIALQNDVPVHRGHDAIQNLTRPSRQGRGQNYGKQRNENACLRAHENLATRTSVQY